MASFNGFILTNKGRELLAKAVAGEQLTFTKMEVGDGTFTGDIKPLTALVSKKDDFNINQIENQGNGQVVLKAIINNQNTTIGYYIREIGVFAHGADNIEILYAYNKAIEADYFPAFNGSNAVEFEYNNIIIVDQAQNITAVIDPSMTYITKEEAANTYVTSLEVRMGDTLNILGLSYGGNFGADLTNIEADKVYFYKDPVSGRETPYVATVDKIGVFITPDIDNFTSLTNRDNLFYKKLNIVTPTSTNFYLNTAYIISNMLIVNAYVTDPNTLNLATLGTEFVNIGTAIPEIKNYGILSDTIAGINLIIKDNFALAKSSSMINFYQGQHFRIICGLTKGTIR